MKLSRHIPRYLLCSVSIAVLAGCGGMSILPESKKIEYKSEGKKLRPLEVPPDLTAPGRDERYSVPDVARGPTTFSAYSGDRKAAVTSGNNDVLPQVGELRIDRSGNQRWLVVPGVSPDKVWSTVKEFWQETGMLVNIELPEAGIMETDWAENRAKLPQDAIRNLLGKALDSLYSTAERDKYRTRLEKSGDATEIYISHRGMYEVYVTEGKSETRWQPREPDPELEAEMLRRLMVRLGAEESKAKSMLAAAPKEERAKLNRSGPGGGTLEVIESFDRAWRRIGLALDRVGFTVEDRDRSQGIYYVRYVDPDADSKSKKDEEGLLSKFAFWKSSGDKGLTKNTQYRIFIKGSGDSSTVQVLTREGGVDAGDGSRKILGLLYEQLK